MKWEGVRCRTDDHWVKIDTENEQEDIVIDG